MARAIKPIAIYCFGPFRLDAPAGVLTRDGVPVALSARAFAVLELLVRREGDIVTRDEILAEVWRGVTVEENNLTVQISALRRALGDMPGQAPVIITVPNQGYRIAGTVTQLAPPAAATPPPAETPNPPPVAPSRRAPRALAAGGVLAVLAVTAAAAILIRPPPAAPTAASPSAPLLSLVILPFRNLATDHQDDPLADAVSDDLTTEMAHMPAATVIARETADSYRGRAVPVAQIGAALNVRYVLEGSLRGLPTQIAVNAQLIDAATGAHVWARRFDVPRDPAAELQPAIVFRIASGLRTALIADAAAKSLAEHPQNPTAMDLYVRAGAIWDREETMASMRSARPLLEKAIKLQPDFVPALAALGAEVTVATDFEGSSRGSPRLAEAHDVIDRALALARDAPEVQSAQGFLQLTEGKIAQAEASFRAAVAVDPGSRGGVTGLWLTAFMQGHWQEAYDGVLRAMLVDPEGPGASFREEQLGMLALLLGRPAEAEARIAHGIAAWPAPKPGAPDWDPCGNDNLLLIAAHAEDGDLPGARKLVAEGDIDWPHRSAFRCMRFGTPAQSRDPGMKRAYAAVLQAGLPEFSDENADDAVPATTVISRHAPFDPTPPAVPGVPTIDTPALRTLIQQSPPPLLIDMGAGIARPTGAIPGNFDPISADSAKHFAASLPPHAGRPVVVLGDGVYGWRAYNGVLQLRAAGVANLLWYRGGEEAWAKAGLPAEDARAP